MLHIKLAVPVSNLDYTAFLVQSVVMNSNLMGDKFLCNFGMKFQHQFIIFYIWNYKMSMATFCMFQCQNGVKVLNVMNENISALKDTWEINLNTWKSTSRRILTGILLKISENCEIEPNFMR